MSVEKGIETNATEIIELDSTIESHAKSLGDHESRLRVTERIVGEVARDVKWLREYQENRERPGGR